jgi:ADP-heptose:LPS heptosyltransferase
MDARLIMSQNAFEKASPLSGGHLQVTCVSDAKTDAPRFLVTVYTGIGDAVAVGLSAIDQIIENDPEARGKIDVLCNPIQAELFAHDPRVNRIIQVSRSLFPPPSLIAWLYSGFTDPEANRVVHFLRSRQYEAVLPGIFAPIFYRRLQSRIMYPRLWKLVKYFLALRALKDIPMSKIVRQIVNRFFGKDMPMSALSENIPLYIPSTQIRDAEALVTQMRKKARLPDTQSKLLVVAPDSSSIITRPPAALLVAALIRALKKCPNLLVCVLPSYTDTTASERLWQSLASDFAGRVFLLALEPGLTLLETTALIDQSDILVTGDTGVMHLAAATKKVQESNNTAIAPRNSVKIIALFGGTCPELYGYRTRTTILGRGRKEQTAYRPGIIKESYNPKNRDFFDHISPEQLTEAILSHL